MNEPDSPPRRHHYFAVALVYTSFIAYGSWVPLEASGLSLEEAWARFVSILTASGGRPGRIDFCTNVLLFVPVSFLWLAALAADRRLSAAALFAPLVAIGSGLWSLIVEFGQMWLDRTPSRFDVYAQLLGTAVGIAAWLTIGRRLTVWLRSFALERQPTRRLDWVLKTYYGILFLVCVMPLDLTLHPHDLYAKYQRGRIALVPFANLAPGFESLLELLFDALVCVPLGALGVRLLRGNGAASVPNARNVRDSLPAAIAVAAGLVAAIEFAQLFVVSRFTETGDVLTGTAGAAVGAWLMRRYGGDSLRRMERRGELWSPDGTPAIDSISHHHPTQRAGPALGWLALAAVYLSVPCLFFWSPFDFTADPDVLRAKWEGLSATPFYRLYRVSNLNAHTQILRKVLLFAPLGILLACAVRRIPGSRRHRRWAATAACVLILAAACAIELGQVFLPTRIPDVTDVILLTASGTLGLWLALRILPARSTASRRT